jgi:4-amino-4-deoxy-L-arabinose transferase-like glycosyltransferase
MGASTLRIWILLGVLWLANLPLRPLFDPDEGRYAEIPREMVAASDWVTPTLNGLKYFEKPPLQYWATAALYEVFGLHDWTARLWAAGLAFLCIPLVYNFAMRLGYARDTALIAAALLASNPYFGVVGQLNLLDQGFTFFLNLTLFAFALAQRATAGGKEERNWMLVTWAGLALAVLSKGIVTLVLAGATLLIYMLVSRDASLLKRLRPGLGLPLFLLISLPWFLLVQSRNPEFSQFFFVHEHFARYLTNVSNREQPWWYFLLIMLVALLPVIWNVRHWFRPTGTAAGTTGFRVERLLLIWCAVVFLLFSTSHSKLASYLMPLMPALAVLLARSTAAQPGAFRRAWIMVMFFLLAAAAGIAIQSARRVGPLSSGSLIWVAATVGLCVVFLVFTLGRRDVEPADRWLSLAVLSIAGFQSLSMCYNASFPARGAVELAALSAPRISATTQLYFVGHYRQTLSWYLRREIPVYDYVGELEFGMQHSNLELPMDSTRFLRYWQQDSDALAFITPRDYAALSAQGMPGHVVASDARSIVMSRQ